ncbi:asparagine synthase (glutamine-hydrolyzing) [Synechococcus sp. Cruz-9H2]|uniref:asparagine synthase (glutamine-hydrolyzing) n=1 Tax=unclassified Synechococcus TaxID=2626047 RepID=UPI0020CED459|nr:MULTISPECIES: asparagine synthase (glutamine-hydrolyzing) [unclassified Synechococcus]MCP9818863.1 asparagine synthase (glutamine-hydrolyzing) [Synechococcus sp. Cruz-9H2]MCP9843366.1 asparagine synthase (glutamine-hydrolyzing) [Synechococcus sp. Edmonson 11F2]MCP9855251.1 asparagine synthase (glutamine-hydrolyzing) [Synechococcus sp. Cruz-9C9]MCP9862776.1 asparagine synthase (glutamine-hydrolyzing) [Synechococcus sp. Cruz-7E5]MCP9869773.1 asparagine synthase (glutamine-hydrolyzing) [Synech
MCGIAGVIRPDAAAYDHHQLVNEFQRSLSHRGPDGRGDWQETKTCSVSFVHTLLAIRDPSPLAGQPMTSSCGRYVLVFNGELYNLEEVVRLLPPRRRRLRTRSDSEVLLEFLAERWVDALPSLRGMYAFALWDRERERCLLARDPFGIKPLYVRHGEQGEIWFASEVRALLRVSTRRGELDVAALASFLSWGFVPEPFSLVQGIESLPAGCFGIWEEGRWSQGLFQPPPFPAEAVVADGDAVELVRDALRCSTRAHLTDDPSVGLCLSGGRDSATLMALSPFPLPCFTLGFAEPGFDESRLASRLAGAWQRPHHLRHIGAHRAALELHSYLAAMDQPSTDGFNTYCLARLIRESGVRVVLSGIGGDELFGGYPTFERIPHLLRLHAELGHRSTTLALLHGRCPGAESQRLAGFLGGAASIDSAYRCLRGLFAPPEVQALLESWGLGEAAATASLSVEPHTQCNILEHKPAPHVCERIACLESSHYMAGQLLRDADVFAMAHGVELRLPMVDPALVAVVARLPWEQRFGPGKELLRRAVPELDPLLGNCAKRTFSFPFQRWLDSPDGGFAETFSRLPSLPVPETVDTHPWQRRWALMTLGWWMSTHLDFELSI